MIGSFSHDNLDQADGAGVNEQHHADPIRDSDLQIRRHNQQEQRVYLDFATSTTTTPSPPLTVLGGGPNSIFGPGGVVDGVGSVIRNVQTMGTY